MYSEGIRACRLECNSFSWGARGEYPRAAYGGKGPAPPWPRDRGGCLHSRSVTSEGATAQNVKSATFSVFFYRRKLCPRKKIGHKRRDVSRKKLDFCEICVIILTEADETDSIRTSPAWKLFRKLEVNATQMLTHSMYRPFKKAYLSAGAVAAASGNPFNSLLCSGRWCDETPRRASKMLTAFGGSHEHHEEAD